jgi:nitroreductase
MDVMDAIMGRRSIRKYKSTPVSEGDLNAVLEAGRWAPSWANSQCWEIIVVTRQEIKDQLCSAFDPAVKNPAAGTISTAPVVLVLAAKKNRSGYYKGKAVTKLGDWGMFDLALAMENITLAAHNCGLGTVILGAFDQDVVARILCTPDDVMVVAMTPLGYPDIAPQPTPRKPLSEIVSYEQYGQRQK